MTTFHVRTTQVVTALGKKNTDLGHEDSLGKGQAAVALSTEKHGHPDADRRARWVPRALNPC